MPVVNTRGTTTLNLCQSGSFKSNNTKQNARRKMNLYYAELLKVIEDKETIKKCVLKVMQKKKVGDPHPPIPNITIEINGLPERRNEDMTKIARKLFRYIEAGVDDSDVLKAIRYPHPRYPRPTLVITKSKKVRDQIIEAYRRYNDTHPKRNLNSVDLHFSAYIIPLRIAEYPSPINEMYRAEVWKIGLEHGDKYTKFICTCTNPPTYMQ